MNVARVRGGVVINIEAADEEWLRTMQATKIDDGVELIAYTDDNPAHIGYGYDPAHGFEQPPNDDEEAAP